PLEFSPLEPLPLVPFEVSPPTSVMCAGECDFPPPPQPARTNARVKIRRVMFPPSARWMAGAPYRTRCATRQTYVSNWNYMVSRIVRRGEKEPSSRADLLAEGVRDCDRFSR